MADLFYRVLQFFGYEHPLHPVLTHLVVGPIIAGFIFELIGFFRKNEGLRKTAWHLTTLAFVFWFLTVANGFIDWAHYYNLSRIPDITVKIILSGFLFVLLLGLILIRKRLSERSPVTLIVLAISTLAVAALGFFGGNLVYGGSEPVEVETIEAVEGEFNETKVNDFTLEWRVNTDTLDVRLNYPTTGWIAVGFGSTGRMEGSDIYIGYVAEDGSIVVVDSFGASAQAHVPDTDVGGTDNVTDVTGEERRGQTTLAFTIPLDSGEETDVQYVAGRTYQVILARAGEDQKDLESYHGTDGRLAFEITL